MAAVLVLAAGLRFAGLGWGLFRGTSFHPDEDKILWQLDRMRLDALDLDPKDFGWGTLHTYVVGVTVFTADRLGVFGEGWRRAFREGREPHFSRLVVTGRAVSALFGLLTVAMVAAIAWNKGGARAGVLAASLLAVSPLHVLHSHYLTADVALSFWLAAAFWALSRSPLLAGFLAGLALATKPSALAFAPVILASTKKGKPRVFALLGIGAGFLAGEPYAVLAFRQWWSASLETASRIGAGSPEAFPIGELLARHALQLSLYGLGPLAAAAAVAGLLTGGRALAAAAGALAFTLALSRFPMGRYALPLLPFLAVTAALAVVRLRGRALALTLSIALIPPLAYSTAAVALLFEAHPYQEAARWIEAKVPAGADVARLWAEYPPLDVTRYRLTPLGDAFGLEAKPYQALTADVVVLDDLPLHAWRPELLNDLAARYAEAASFRLAPTLFGFVLPEPRAPHDSRYPHPEVRVLQRR